MELARPPWTLVLQAAAALATVNYAGYLAGALLGIVVPAALAAAVLRIGTAA